MYDINFLTPEYLEKLERTNLMKKCAAVLGFILLAELLILSCFSIYGASVKYNLENVKHEVKLKEKELEKIETKLAKVPDLNGKISVIENIFGNKNFRVSEVIRNLDKDIPGDLWLNQMTYSSGVINITGISYHNGNMGLTSEENLYLFEKNMIESGSYEEVHHEYTRSINKNGNTANEFQFRLKMEGYEEVR